MIQYYYPRTIRTIVTALIDVFNDIVVYNYIDAVSGATSAANIVNVPIKFGLPDKKYMERTEEEAGKRYYQNLPSISIVWKNAEYDSNRSVGSNEYRYFYNDEVFTLDGLDFFTEDTQPAPYNLNFDMKIKTNSMDHVCQIAEQILPYFNPTLNVKIKEFSFINIKRNIKIRLDSVDLEIQEELDQDNRREINASVSIVAETVLYKPYTTSNIIKEIISNFYIDTNSVSGTDDPYQKLVETYRTSGVDGFFTSAFPSRFETSAYDAITGVYTFTSGVGYY